MRLPRKWVLSLGLMAAAPGATFAGPLDFLKPTQEATAAGAPQSNQQVAEAVAAALRQARLAGKDISIEVKGGVCTLEGQIADAQQKAAATQIVSGVPGVKTVNNRLVVAASSASRDASAGPREMPSDSGVQQAGFEGAPRRQVKQVSHEAPAAQPAQPQSNEQVAREVANAISSAGLQGYDIEVRFKGGVAALIGDVGSAQEAAIAQQAAQSVPGVNQVLNRLTVGGQPAAPQLQMASAQQMASPAGVPAMPTGYTLPPGYPQEAPVPGYGAPVPTMPVPAGGHLIHNRPNMPEHAWPAYAPYDNYAQVTYPSAYDASAWPYIGPFYPYPQVPLEWRSAQLEWDDGFWQLKFHSRTDRWWWFLNPHNWH